MNAIAPTLTCPHCPRSLRTFSAHGLKVHIGRKHKDECPTSATPQSIPRESTSQVPSQEPRPSPLDRISCLKSSTPVLKHIPRGARNQAAGRLCDVIDRCVSCNGVEDWGALLTFAYRALRVPLRNTPGNVTAKVKANIRSFGSDENVDEPCNSSGHSGFSGSRTRKIIESKVYDGDLRGAVRLLVSEDSLAQHGPDTFNALRLKHPNPSRPLIFPQEPDSSFSAATVSSEDVALALGTFYSGSAAGLDGLRPGHLRELTSGSAGDNAQRLLACLTKLTNFLLSGQLNPEVCPYLYGASLCALSKKDGGVRPIAIGSVFRRLAAKLACQSVREAMAEYLQPHQLGFGTSRGCEAAIHATRTFVMNPDNAGSVVLKVDIRNVFNTVERDVLLSQVKDQIPSLYPFLFQVYYSPSHLFFNESLIPSQVGVQQGDPLGPLVFSLAIHKIILQLNSTLNLWYLDDGTLGGPPQDVHKDLEILIPRLKDLGLEVNPSKCEFYPCGTNARTNFNHFSSILPGLKELSPQSFTLLGSPIFTEGLSEAISSRRTLLLTAQERLKDLSAHVALILLRMCFAIPKVTYLLRTAPTWLCPDEISAFDESLKLIVESIINVSLNESQWRQATLPIRDGGIGLRCARDVGLPAFLASAHGVEELVAVILDSNGSSDRVNVPFVAEGISAWSDRSSGEAVPAVPRAQRAWDKITIRQVKEQLVEGASGSDLARLRAVSQPESGAWLHALPSPHLGTFLDDNSLRVALSLRLGCKVCEPHICTCGSMVETDGHHALSCRRSIGRFPRHHALNDIIRRAFVSADVPCVLEPPGLSRSDGKRPDGMTLVPWKNGKCLVWDATCVSTVAPSHLSRTTLSPAAAAEDAAYKKRQKYSTLEAQYLFVPFAVETLGSWGADAKTLTHELGIRIRKKTGDPRSRSYLEQRLAIAVQRGNATSVVGTFAPGTLGGGLLVID